MCMISMDIILEAIKRVCKCLEDICNDIECKIDSGCCQTYKHVHSRESVEDKNDELKIDFKKYSNNIE